MEAISTKKLTPYQKRYLDKIKEYGYHRLDVELNLLHNAREYEIFSEYEEEFNMWQLGVVINLMLSIKR